jgi:hypothetical protein
MRVSPKTSIPAFMPAIAAFAAITLSVALTGTASADQLRERFVAATTDTSAPGGAVFAADQAGCVYDRFAAKADDVRTLGLVLAMEGQRNGQPDVPFMIQNQATYDAAAKSCGAEQ